MGYGGYTTSFSFIVICIRSDSEERELICICRGLPQIQKLEKLVFLILQRVSEDRTCTFLQKYHSSHKWSGVEGDKASAFLLTCLFFIFVTVWTGLFPGSPYINLLQQKQQVVFWNSKKLVCFMLHTLLWMVVHIIRCRNRVKQMGNCVLSVNVYLCVS